MSAVLNQTLRDSRNNEQSKPKPFFQGYLTHLYKCTHFYALHYKDNTQKLSRVEKKNIAQCCSYSTSLSVSDIYWLRLGSGLGLGLELGLGLGLD
jgi:hypothetical protein